MKIAHKQKQSMSKRNSIHDAQSDTIAIHDLQAAQNLLASYDCSSATIGIQSFLVRHNENEQLLKFLQDGTTIEDYLVQLDDKEKNLNGKCQLDTERCASITRLRQYLKEEGESFSNILKQLQTHLNQSMRDDPEPSLPKTVEELTQQCQQRNFNAIKLQLAYRMCRLQFYDNNPTGPSMNIINLQKWILAHRQLLMNIPQTPSNSSNLNKYFEDLLLNSFFIIQHPTPTIATHSPKVNGAVTAKINCKIMCLLDKSHPNITIDNITPSVRCITTYNQIGRSDIVYEQPQLNWKTYYVITASNNYSTFLCGDISKISLKQPSTTTPDQKTHYAPLVYCIDFGINVTIRFHNNETVYKTLITVQSAPFGLISHTSQEEDLLAKVFIEDLRYWKFYQTSLLSMLNEVNPSPVTADLTIDDIVNSIERYFIHTTGIRPKEWTMPYIRNVFQTVCQNQSNSIETLCHNYLVKILAQIDYMAKHPLLILFHYDGLFLGICDDKLVDDILLNYRQYCQKSICAIRFGAMNRMFDLKEIGISVMLVDKLSSDVKRWKFDTTKISMDLGLYIIKIYLCKASQFDSILTSSFDLNISSENNQNTTTDITKFVQLYHSEKLMTICPHDEEYHSIWTHTYNDEMVARTCKDDPNNPPYTTDQLQPYHSEELLGSQIIQTNSQPAPVIIVVNNRQHSMMSNDDVMLLVNNSLPQIFQSFPASPIFRIDTD